MAEATQEMASMTSEVTQADRDAAKLLLDKLRIREHETGSFRAWDETVEAFARHRLTAQSGEGRSGAGEDWVSHDGGDCPVDPAATVEIKLRDGSVTTMTAKAVTWRYGTYIFEAHRTMPASCEVVAYRLAALNAQSGEGRSGAGDSNLDARKAVNGVLAGLLAPLMSDTPKMIEIGNQACTEILASLAALNARQSGEGELEDELARVVHANGPVVVDWMGECLAWRRLDYGTWSPLAALRATDDAGGAAKAPDTGEGE